jgi:Mrp family chromosome partitioning ATPase
VLADWVDGVIVVVDLGGSTDRSVRDALRQLEAVQARVLGLVLNRDPSVEPSAYDYYLSVASDRDAEPVRTGPAGSS